jgi:tetratricopeptide (TPR) repeat protein
MRALLAGRFADAEILIQDGLDAGPVARGFETSWFFALRVQAWALARERGRLPEVQPDIERLVEDEPTVAYLPAVLASLHGDLGHRAQARERFEALAADDFADLAETDWLFQISLLSQVCAFLGDTRRAARLYDLLLPFAGCTVLAYPELSVGSASRYLGLLARTLSRWEEAERHYEAAIAMNAALGARPWLAHTDSDYAGMLLARNDPGDSERAQPLLDAALSLYRELGMGSYAAKASTLAQQVGSTA